MKKHLIIGALVLAALAAGGAVFFRWLSPPEFTHAGRPLGAWLDELENGRGDTRARAEAALREMGTNVFPTLLADLQAHDTGLEPALREFAAWLPFASPPPKAVTRRERAAVAFRALGSNAAPATLPLIEILLHGRASIYAAHVLAGLGPEAVIPLRAALTNESRHVRTSAAFGLGTLTEGGAAAVPPLVEVLKGDRNAGVRATAADALGELGELPETAVPALVKSLGERARSVRLAAVKALAKFGAQAREAIPELSKMAADEDADLASAAAEALKTITNAAAAGAHQ